MTSIELKEAIDKIEHLKALLKYAGECGHGQLVMQIDELENENEKLKQALDVAVKMLNEFADHENPNEPNRVCWPKNEYMKKSRQTLTSINEIMTKSFNKTKQGE